MTLRKSNPNKPKRPRGHPKKLVGEFVQTGIWIQKEQLTRLKDKAASQRKTASEIIRNLIDDYLDEDNGLAQ